MNKLKILLILLINILFLSAIGISQTSQKEYSSRELKKLINKIKNQITFNRYEEVYQLAKDIVYLKSIQSDSSSTIPLIFMDVCIKTGRLDELLTYLSACIKSSTGLRNDQIEKFFRITLGYAYFRLDSLNTFNTLWEFYDKNRIHFSSSPKSVTYLDFVYILVNQENYGQALEYAISSQEYNSGELLFIVFTYSLINKRYDIAEKVYLTNINNRVSEGKKLFETYFANQQFADAERIYLSQKDNFSDLGRKLFETHLQNNHFADAERIYFSQKDNFSDLGRKLFETHLQNQQFADAERVFYSDTVKYRPLGEKLTESYLNQNRFLDALRVSKSLPYYGRNVLYRFAANSISQGYSTARDTFKTKSLETHRIRNVSSNRGYINRFFQSINSSIPDSIDNYNADVHKIIQVYRGGIEPMLLIEKITSERSGERLGKLCTANYFIGFKYDMEGNHSLANQYYTQAVATDQTDMFEYHLAQKALQNVTALDMSIDKKLQTIAVIDFEANGYTEVEAKVIANRTASILTKMNRFIVLERAKMDEILKEQGFQLSGCTSDRCVVEVGQLLGVQLMLAGTIGRFGELNIIEMRIIDVETSKILRSTSYELSGAKELLLTQGVSLVLNELLR